MLTDAAYWLASIWFFGAFAGLALFGLHTLMPKNELFKNLAVRFLFVWYATGAIALFTAIVAACVE